MKIRKSWFGTGAPKNFKPATNEIGSGTDGKVAISLVDIDVENATGYSLEVKVGTGEAHPLTVTYVGTAVVVTLATDDNGDADEDVNTAANIASAISEVKSLSADYSGDGTGVFSGAVSKKNFTNGQFATMCHDDNVVVAVWDDDENIMDYYINLAPNGRADAHWRKFNLTAY